MLSTMVSTYKSVSRGIESILKFTGTASKSYSKIKPGAVQRDLGRLRLQIALRADPSGFIKAVAKVGADAMQNMAYDTREKLINSIMGNRANPYNVFPKNKVNARTGQFYKNSIARPYPKAPRPYTQPGNPIALQQVIFRDAKGSRSSIIVEGQKVVLPEKLVGPMAGFNVTMRGVPGLLEKGGTTSSYYRFMPAKAVGGKSGVPYREEFTKAPKKTEWPKQVPGRPKWKNSWTEVRAAAKANGTATKKVRKIVQELDPSWKGPKTFNVRGRHYVRNAWLKVKPRAKRHLDMAKSKLPAYLRQNMKLKTFAKRVIK